MRSRARTAVVALVIGAATVALPRPAQAVPTCTYDAPTLTVTIAVGSGESATIARSVDLITLDGVPCGAAAVQTTDTIVVNGTGGPTEVAIDLSGGPFEPGATPETDGGASEIEFTVNLSGGAPTLRIAGAPGADNIVLGTAGINLNAVEANGDLDVSISGGPAIVIAGGGGDDILSVANGADNVIDGGDGDDTIDFSAASAVNVDLRVGSSVGDGTDALSSIENVIGSPLEDHLVGSGGANRLDGGPGDDKIDGVGGDDTLTGGGGTDTVSFQSAAEGVTVSLTRGTAEGAGADTLEGFENVVGTPEADEIHGDGARNRLDGRRGPDQLFGGGGADIIQGGDGNDLLFGQSGNDLLLGDSAKDQLDGGQDRDVCRGGTGPDSFVFCETVKAGPPRLI